MTASPRRHVMVLLRSLRTSKSSGDSGSLGLVCSMRNGGGVDAEPAHAELEPERDDLADLGADLWVSDVEVWLEIVEAVVVPGVRFLVERPRLLLDAGEDDAVAPVVGISTAAKNPEERVCRQ